MADMDEGDEIMDCIESAEESGDGSDFDEAMEDAEDGDKAKSSKGGGKKKHKGDKGEKKKGPEVFIPGRTEYEGEELESDPSAYVFLHQLQAGAPCLSFDILPDKLGNGREEFPLSCYIVSGSEKKPSFINIMKLHNITKTQKDEDDDDSEDEDSADEEDDDNPQLNLLTIEHIGGVNRLRVTQFGDKVYSGTWSDRRAAYVYDITEQTAIVDDASAASKYNSKKRNVVHAVKQHTIEGFAIDWSSVTKGWLATGDCAGTIYLSHPSDTGWMTEPNSLPGHTDSVEDIQWSSNEGNVFASCSVDRSIRIWNTQQKPASANVLTVPEAHGRDINVINWNTNEKHLIASGGDDGIIQIWDLRMFQSPPVTAQGNFKLHTQPITSLEWNPQDSSVLAASGADNQISIWDFSVEGEAGQEDLGLPTQLLFQHCGQTDIKELHWHPQLPGVIISTGNSDFNIFRTISV